MNFYELTKEEKVQVLNAWGHQLYKQMQIEKNKNQSKYSSDKFYFHNRLLDITVHCTRKDMKELFGLSKNNIYQIIKGKRKTIHGWTVLKEEYIQHYTLTDIKDLEIQYGRS